MKRVGGILRLFALSLLLTSLSSVAFAGLDKSPLAGDEDPFPLRCADFSGDWKSDKGSRFAIAQRQCSYLRFQLGFGTDGNTLTVVPDNRMRPGPVRGMQVRYRWNSPQMGTVLETHRVYLEGQIRVTEVVMLERAGGDVLLETIYRTIECPTAPNPRRAGPGPKARARPAS